MATKITFTPEHKAKIERALQQALDNGWDGTTSHGPRDDAQDICSGLEILPADTDDDDSELVAFLDEAEEVVRKWSANLSK